jgi:hypothetical protein
VPFLPYLVLFMWACCGAEAAKSGWAWWRQECAAIRNWWSIAISILLSENRCSGVLGFSKFNLPACRVGARPIEGNSFGVARWRAEGGAGDSGTLLPDKQMPGQFHPANREVSPPLHRHFLGRPNFIAVSERVKWLSALGQSTIHQPFAHAAEGGAAKTAVELRKIGVLHADEAEFGFSARGLEFVVLVLRKVSTESAATLRTAAKTSRPHANAATVNRIVRSFAKRRMIALVPDCSPSCSWSGTVVVSFGHGATKAALLF